MSWMRFRDRKHAGQLLARALVKRRVIHDPVVVAIPRGGAAVGAEVAQRLGAPFDLRIVVKVCVPGHEELAMGAVGAHGLHVLDESVVNQLPMTPAALGRALAQAESELDRREALLQSVRRPPVLAGRSVLLIDDGMASGATMAAAVRALRREGPSHILAAVPVAPEAAIVRLSAEADDVVCLHRPSPFFGIGMWYEDFPRLADAEVRSLLRRSRSLEPVSAIPYICTPADTSPRGGVRAHNPAPWRS